MAPVHAPPSLKRGRPVRTPAKPKSGTGQSMGIGNSWVSPRALKAVQDELKRRSLAGPSNYAGRKNMKTPEGIAWEILERSEIGRRELKKFHQIPALVEKMKALCAGEKRQPGYYLTTIKDEGGNAALHHAAAWGDEKVVESLLTAGAGVNKVSSGLMMDSLWTRSRNGGQYALALGMHGGRVPGYTPLSAAVVAYIESPDPEGLCVVRRLLEAGAKVNLPSGLGITVLMEASRTVGEEAKAAAAMVKLLLASGADPAQKSKDGRTALAWALSAESPHSCDIETPPSLPVVRALMTGMRDKGYFGSGRGLWAQDENGRTGLEALYASTWNNRQSLAKLIIPAMFDPHSWLGRPETDIAAAWHALPEKWRGFGLTAMEQLRRTLPSPVSRPLARGPVPS